MTSRVTLTILGVLFLVSVFVYWPESSADHRDLPERFPVRGTVSYNGKAPVGAYVILTPLPLKENDWKTLIPKGRVEEDGTYTVQSYQSNDGAPAGEYAVTIAWTGYRDRNVKPGRDRWGGFFNKPEKPEHTITVESEEVVIPPIELNGPPIDVGEPKADAPDTTGRIIRSVV